MARLEATPSEIEIVGLEKDGLYPKEIITIIGDTRVFVLSFCSVSDGELTGYKKELANLEADEKDFLVVKNFRRDPRIDSSKDHAVAAAVFVEKTGG